MYVIYYVTATGVQLLHPLGSRQRHADRNRFSPGHALFNRVGSGPKDLRLVYPGHGPLQRLRQSRTGSYTTRGPHGKKEVVGRTAAPDAKHFDPGRSGCYQQLRRRGDGFNFFYTMPTRYHAEIYWGFTEAYRLKSGLIETHLAISRNGRVFERLPGRPSLIGRRGRRSLGRRHDLC